MEHAAASWEKYFTKIWKYIYKKLSYIIETRLRLGEGHRRLSEIVSCQEPLHVLDSIQWESPLAQVLVYLLVLKRVIS